MIFLFEKQRHFGRFHNIQNHGEKYIFVWMLFMWAQKLILLQSRMHLKLRSLQRSLRMLAFTICLIEPIPMWSFVWFLISLCFDTYFNVCEFQKQMTISIRKTNFSCVKLWRYCTRNEVNYSCVNKTIIIICKDFIHGRGHKIPMSSLSDYIFLFISFALICCQTYYVLLKLLKDYSLFYFISI